ncbi:hypothetical protein LTR56_022835 [Elasticomyces elasticus]|nr:hypothetical protein LTR56_022835 [Elasticomyces elasticus]KAK3627472.1 hypothetical protein LTR22_022748 [Elasticomyces elasticus]KAK4907631.1 hypothetical protein LTR49_023384 [Elasticomyces elasticus]KAK5753449.1 hypothetical protein LTS12_016500 [Elasticomyces elasticus]
MDTGTVDQTQTQTPAQQKFRRFCEIRDQLIEEIQTLTGREGGTQQIWADAPRIVFLEHTHLLVELHSSGGNALLSSSGFRRSIIGRSIEYSRARVFATLLSTGIDPHKDSWPKLCKALADTRGDSAQLFDYALPLSRHKIVRLLGEQVATDFCEQQSKYCMPDAAGPPKKLRNGVINMVETPRVHDLRLASSPHQPVAHEDIGTPAIPNPPPRITLRRLGQLSGSYRAQRRNARVAPDPFDSISDRPRFGSSPLSYAVGYDTHDLALSSTPGFYIPDLAFWPATADSGKSEDAGSSAEVADLHEKVAALKVAVDDRDDLKAYNTLVTRIDPGLLKISLHRMAETMQPETIRTLLDLGVAIDEPDGEGRTALVYALERNRYDVACLLTERGARIDLPDNQGCTALHHAVRGVVRSHHADEVVTRLLAAPNALVSVQNHAGDTPLHICAHSCTPSARHYAEVMLDHDSIAVELRNRSGLTPLDLVTRNMGPDTDRMLKLLLRYATRSTASSKWREGVDTSQGPNLILERVNLNNPVQPVSPSTVKSSLRAASLLPVGAESHISISRVATVSEEWIQSFVDTLFSSEEFTLLSNAAIHDQDIGYGRYWRELRLLFSVGTNLTQKTCDRVAGKILRKCASTNANEYARKTPVTERKSSEHGPKESLGDRLSIRNGNVRLPDLRDDLDGGPSGTSGGDSTASNEGSLARAVEADHPEEAVFGGSAPLKEFILESGAFGAFLVNLADLVRSKYVKRLDKIIVTADTTPGLQELRGLALERIWLSQHDVRFSFAETISLEDRVKGHVEDCLGENWNWWPLRPRSLLLKDGYTRVHWRCNCDEQRSADLQASISNELQVALQPTPSWINVLSTSTPTVRPGGVPSASAPSTNAPSQHATGVVAQATVPSSGSGVPGLSATPIPSTAAFSQHGMSTQATVTSEHVFLGARRGLDLRIADLQVQSMNDEEFFRRLKYDYRQLRGRLRLWLSWWRFDHCEFFRFEKFAEDEFVPRNVDFPHISNLEYSYTPRPIDPRPPISKHEFRKRYYHNCNQPSSWHRPWHNCTKFCSRRSQALAVVPKRIRVLETGGDAREDFWGILAQERRYFAWVLGYFLLTLVPSIVFFFMWLFRWSHVNDLQNASVPITVTLGLWAVFAAVLWQDRAVVWED